MSELSLSDPPQIYTKEIFKFLSQSSLFFLAASSFSLVSSAGRSLSGRGYSISLAIRFFFFNLSNFAWRVTLRSLQCWSNMSKSVLLYLIPFAYLSISSAVVLESFSNFVLFLFIWNCYSNSKFGQKEILNFDYKKRVWVMFLFVARLEKREFVNLLSWWLQGKWLLLIDVRISCDCCAHNSIKKSDWFVVFLSQMVSLIQVVFWTCWLVQTNQVSWYMTKNKWQYCNDCPEIKIVKI